MFDQDAYWVRYKSDNKSDMISILWILPDGKGFKSADGDHYVSMDEVDVYCRCEPPIGVFD